MTKLTKESILQAGYYQYKPTPFDSSYVIARYQKRFDDEIGKKYFIDIVHWGSYPGMDREAFEFETQLYKKGTHDPVNLTCFSGWGIKEVEDFLETIWDPDIFDYYEEWD